MSGSDTQFFETDTSIAKPTKTQRLCLQKGKRWTAPSTMSLLRYWNIGCAVCIGLPLLILIVNRLFVRFGGEGGGGEADWGWGEDPEDRGVTTLFAYLWAMLLFLVLAFYGNAVLSGHNDNGAKWYKPFHDDSHPSATRNLGILTGATLVFANLAFVLFLVFGASSVRVLLPIAFWEMAALPQRNCPTHHCRSIDRSTGIVRKEKDSGNLPCLFLLPFSCGLSLELCLVCCFTDLPIASKPRIVPPASDVEATNRTTPVAHLS